MLKKIAIVGTVGLPAKYGGFETLTEHLVENKEDEFDFLVYCSKLEYSKRPRSYGKATLKYIPLRANGAQSIPYDIWSILHALFYTDIILILGVSGCIILPFIRLFSSKKIIVNIDGLEWRREKWSKNAKRFLKFSEKIAVKYADIVVADNKIIQQHVKDIYDITAKFIPYGGDHAKPVDMDDKTLEELPFLSQPYAFKVCRIVPENNVEMILKAFANYAKLNLVIVGNWEVNPYSQELKKRYLQFPNLFLLDPIYDQNKLNQLRSNCYLYVHGHSAGGTNPSLVEAMFSKLPVLAYSATYNKKTTQHKALYFDDETTLIALLENLKQEELDSISEQMSTIALKDYTWKKVSNAYTELLLN